MYNLYYREKGCRYPDQLLNAERFSLIEFPRESLFHVYDDGDNDPDIDTSKSYYKNYSKKIIAEQITEYFKPEGQFRKPGIPFRDMLRPWKRDNIQSWILGEESWKTNHTPDQLIVVNYGYLDKLHRYIPVQMAEYYRWKNTLRTMLAKMNEIAEVSLRNQFIVLKVPQVLQGRTMLEKFQDKEDSVMAVNVFGAFGMDGFLQLELWRWIGVDYRKKSLFNLIDPKNYSKINLIFEGKTGKQVLVNLGYLNSWIKGQTNTTELGSVIQFSAINMQKLFLKLCIVLNGAVSEESEEGELSIQSQGPITQPSTTETQAKDDTEETAFDRDPILDASEEELGLDDSDDRSEVSLVDSKKLPKLKSADEIESELDKLSRLKTPDFTEELMDSIDKDLEALDRISLTQLKNRGLTEKIKQAEENPQPKEIEQGSEQLPTVDPEIVKEKVFKSKTSQELLAERLVENATANLITAADYRRMNEYQKGYLESTDPYGSGKKRLEAQVIKSEDVVITPEVATIPISDAIPDKTMGESSLQAYNRQYLKNVYKKDVLRAVDKLQASGVIVKAHEIHQTTSILGTYEHHRLELKPIDGVASVVKFTLPVVQEDGTFYAANNKYILRKQRVDLPIRKISPTIVSLSSYYGKTFVQISPKMVNNSISWIYRQLNLSIVTEGSYIHSVSPGIVFDNELKAPAIYNAIAAEFEKFSAGNNHFNFNYHTRQEYIEPALLSSIEKNGKIFCGYAPGKKPIVVDMEDKFWVVDNSTLIPLGDIFNVLKLPKDKAPIDFCEVRIFSKYIPVGILLGYYIGFSSLLALVGAKYRTVEPRKNKNLQPNEYAIVFKNVTYVFDRDQKAASLIMAGFLDFEKSTKLYDVDLFENKDIYLNLLLTKKIGALYVREMDMMENAFIDPITEEILLSMKEPTTFKGLLYRATELLLTFDHPVSQDRSAMRDRGYERFAGAVYKELIQATRQFRNKNLLGRSKIDISPYQVWNAIMKDNSLKIVEDINPIQNLKENEVITFAGEGGRSKDTMTKPTRAFHVKDVGVLSESTVDSSAVGTIAYLSANPNISTVRGLMKDEKVLNPTTMMSTSALLSPGAFTDNPKRIMFINTQHSHTIASTAYKQPQLRTGYEQVIGRRTGKLFCASAQEDGVIESVSEKGIIVKYQSGEKDGIALGRMYGKAEGTAYPHDLVANVKPGQKVKKGDIIAYNTKFFEPDFKNPNEVCLKIASTAYVAFMEDNSTHEDSATISPELSARLQTEATKIKSYVVRFTQNIHDLRKPGERVEPKDTLMIIEDDITSQSSQFSDEALQTLSRLSKSSPRAGLTGIVEKIEVYYHGEKRDMSQTLRKIVDKSDAEMAAVCKSTNQPMVNGRVTNEYRVSGTPLELDQAEIRIYITTKAPSGVGDKLVFGHQMKSTIAEVHPGEIFTENGLKIDAVFSYRSLANREVHSAAQMGTTMSLLDEIANRAVKSYFGENT